jgi:hypothetical protein
VLEEDAKLTNVVTNNSEKKWGKECNTDRTVATVLVPCQTLHSSIDPALARTGRWAADEDTKLKDAVQMHNGKNWDAIAALVPGRTRRKCWYRWRDALDPRVIRTTGRTGDWTPDEDTKLKDAVHIHGKNWDAIAALVLGRTQKQCYNRWRHVLDPSINWANRCTSKWTPDEDDKLKDAVQMHVRKDWEAIARLMPGRTNTQCRDRWRKHLNPRSAQTPGRTGKWTPDEDNKMKDAVQIHNDNDWDAIAALVPGRTRDQCWNRWHDVLDIRMDRTPGRTGSWTHDEDTKLEDAVKLHNGKNWGAIAALVPGRTKKDCCSRWHFRRRRYGKVCGTNAR